MQNYLLK